MKIQTKISEYLRNNFFLIFSSLWKVLIFSFIAHDHLSDLIMVALLLVSFLIQIIILFIVKYQNSSSQRCFILNSIISLPLIIFSMIKYKISHFYFLIIRTDYYFINKQTALTRIELLIIILMDASQIATIFYLDISFIEKIVLIYSILSYVIWQKYKQNSCIHLKQYKPTQDFQSSNYRQKSIDDQKEVLSPNNEENNSIILKNKTIQTNLKDGENDRWKERLQNFPIGIMILQNENLKITYYNNYIKNLFSFEELQDFENFFLKKIMFKIISKNQKKNRIQKSYHKLMQSLPNIPNRRQETFTTFIKQEDQYNLENILKLYHTNKLADYQQGSQNEIELLAERQNQLLNLIESKLFNQIDEQIQYLSGKIISDLQVSETLIFIQDISKQYQLSKLQIREQFKQKLIYSFSHELRTPLNSASNFLVASLEDQQIDKIFKEKFIHPALNSLKLQSYLINDIIDFTQYFSNILMMEPNYFKIDQLIRDLNDLFHEIFKMKQVGFKIYVKNKLSDRFCSDYQRLLQVLVNLIQNSAKFTFKGFVILKIRFDSQDNLCFALKDEGFFSISISQGIGIEKEKLLMIRNCLLKVYSLNDISNFDSWSGFGLIISQILLQKLAPQNCQQLKITSDGTGTLIQFQIESFQRRFTQNANYTQQSCQTFCYGVSTPNLHQDLEGFFFFFFNLSGVYMINNPSHNQPNTLEFNENVSSDLEANQQNTSVKKQMENLQQQIKIQLNTLNVPRRSFEECKLQNGSSNEEILNNQIIECQCKNKILSVDDEIFNQKSIQLLLESHGFQLLTALNGLLAIELLKKEKKCCQNCRLFKIILMDCQMPMMDGWETTKQINSLITQKKLPYIPIVGLTAFTSLKDIEKCYEVGMVYVFAKPLRIQHFLEFLNQLQDQLNHL